MVRVSISQLNSLGADQFVWALGNVIELHAAAATHVEKMRPFRTSADLRAAFYKYLEDLSVEEKLVVLRLHPDLAGRLAAQGELTSESANEQQSAGLNSLAAEEKSVIDALNKRYKSKFDFPFIICARENKVQSIIEGLQKRYNNTKEEEIRNAISEVQKICSLRILDIVLD